MTEIHPDAVPSLAPELVHLRRPGGASAALHRFVGAALADREGTALWVDAGGDAGTRHLGDYLPRGRGLADVRVARAFTAYQHHELVRRAVREARGACASERASGRRPRAPKSRTGLVVAPCTAALYRDDDVPDSLGRDLLAATLVTLRELAHSLEVPVVVTTPDEAVDHHALVAERADRTVSCERTRAGLRFAGPEAETTVYRDAGGWQTTIPYWVELFGCVCDAEPVTAPATPAVVEG